MKEYNGGGIMFQCAFDYLSWIDSCTVYGTVEHFFVLDNPMLGI